MLGLMVTFAGGRPDQYVSQPTSLFASISHKPIRVIYLIDTDNREDLQQNMADYDAALKKFIDSPLSNPSSLSGPIHKYTMNPEPESDYDDIREWAKLTTQLKDKPDDQVWNHINLLGLILFRIDAQNIAVQLRFGTQWTEILTAFMVIIRNGQELIYCGKLLSPDEVRDNFSATPLPEIQNLFTSPLQTDTDDRTPLIPLPMFGGKETSLTVTDYKEGTFLPTGNGRPALDAFLSIDTNTRNRYSEAIYNICHEYLDLIGIGQLPDTEELKEIGWPEQDIKEHKQMQRLWALKDKNEIWNYIEPAGIIMQQDDGAWYIQIYCHCAWDTEHGINLTFKNGKEIIFDYYELY